MVRSFNAYPRIETMACDSVNGSAGPTLSLGAWMGLGDGGSSTVGAGVAYAVAWTKSQISKQVLVEGEASGMSGDWKRTSRRLRL